MRLTGYEIHNRKKPGALKRLEPRYLTHKCDKSAVLINQQLVNLLETGVAKDSRRTSKTGSCFMSLLLPPPRISE